jgi:hypothetical protein
MAFESPVGTRFVFGIVYNRRASAPHPGQAAASPASLKERRSSKDPQSSQKNS